MFVVQITVKKNKLAKTKLKHFRRNLKIYIMIFCFQCIH